MNRENFVFAIGGIMFGLLTGWILGSQQAGSPTLATPVAAQQAAQLPDQPPPPVLDVQRASALERQANTEPNNAPVRVELGNLYFDAERYDIAASWYEAALKLEPRNVNASTDLGVAYYSLNQIDRALSQFDFSLSIDPAHAKTLFNVGIVSAFGKQDLDAAIKAWERLIAVAPNSEEAARARSAIDTLKTDHPGTAGGGAGGGQ
jgi:cytochrome c-type biogenesis protein CcmH/NrfG